MWFSPKHNFKVCDVVPVGTELGAKDEWPQARISISSLGADGLVRKVDVTTTNAKFHKGLRNVWLSEWFNELNGQIWTYYT